MSALRFVRIFEVKERTGLSKTEIYRRMHDGTFPKAIPLGKRSVAWRSDELDGWFADLIKRATQPAGARESRLPTLTRPVRERTER